MEIKNFINQVKALQQISQLGTNDIAKQMLTQQITLTANNIFENMPLQEIGRQLAAELPIGVLDVTPEMLIQRLPVGALDTTVEQWSQKLVDSIPRENLSMTIKEAIRRAGAEKLVLDYFPEEALHMTAPQLVNRFKHHAPANIREFTLRSAGQKVENSLANFAALALLTTRQQVADLFPQGILQTAGIRHMTFGKILGDMVQYISILAPNFVALTPQQAYQALSAIKPQ